MRMGLGKKSSHILRPCRAFTLNELLVVIAIIAFWAAMFLPALAKAKKRTLATNCLSNLKQIGMSLQSYVDDNEGRLPGPLETASRAGYDQSSNDELVYYMAKYLGDPSPSGKTVLSKTFICPAHLQRTPAATSLLSRKIFLLNDNVDPSPLRRLAPFGDTPSAGEALPPLKISQFDGRTYRRHVFAVSDIDQAMPSLDPSVKWWSDLPNKPVHGAVRNQLFFDWHVQAVKW